MALRFITRARNFPAVGQPSGRQRLRGSSCTEMHGIGEVSKAICARPCHAYTGYENMPPGNEAVRTYRHELMRASIY